MTLDQVSPEVGVTTALIAETEELGLRSACRPCKETWAARAAHQCHSEVLCCSNWDGLDCAHRKASLLSILCVMSYIRICACKALQTGIYDQGVGWCLSGSTGPWE